MTTDTVSPRDQLFNGIFTTALEGGIGYWSQCETYHIWINPQAKSGDLVEDVRGFYADIIEVEDEDEPKHHIDRTVIARGYKLATTTFRDKVYWSTDKPPLVPTQESVDDWDYDAGDADVIVQLGLFGEVVYG